MSSSNDSAPPQSTEVPSAARAPGRRGLGRPASYWTAAFVIALCLWGSGAPSLLYPVYAAAWHLTPTVVTTVFAAYPLALVVMLFVAGGVSDRIGRRATMIAGLVAMAAATLAFLVATDLAWLYVGRALQGVATGLSLSAAGAALVDNDVRRSPVRVGSTTMLANASGLTLAAIVTGALLQYAPLPRHLTFAVLLVLVVSALVLVVLMPPAGSAGGGSWRLQRITVPRDLRQVFLVAAIPVAVVFSVGALLLSLGASMVRDLLHSSNALVAGIMLSVLTVTLAVVGLVLRSMRPHVAIIVGGLLAAAGVGLLQLSASTGSLPVFVVSGVVAGAAYGLSFSGGLRLVNQVAPVAHRSGMLAALYFLAYASQGVIAVLAGLFTTAHGLHRTLDLFVPLLAVAALASTALGVLHTRRQPVPLTPASSIRATSITSTSVPTASA